MQIELIATASEDSAFLPRLGLGVLASLTPPEDEVIYTDDLVRPFDLEKDVKDVDLVGISVDSKTARRSYEIARRVPRARGEGRARRHPPDRRAGGGAALCRLGRAERSRRSVAGAARVTSSAAS